MSIPALIVERLSKSFSLPLERDTSLKQAFLSIGKKKYVEKLDVLRDISFEVMQGEFFGILGRNGSGKSTLLKIIAGIYVPTSGSIIVNGQLTPFIELGIGFNPDLTGKDNVFLNGTIFGMSRKLIEQKYKEIVEFAELERFMDQKLKNYSSGMQVRLAFSIAIQASSGILLLDEVLAVGDARFQQKCYSYFTEIKKRRQTVIFISHDMSGVSRFCDRALLLKGGNIEVMGETEMVIKKYLQENG